MDKDRGFKRAIKLPHATALVAGTIIGASIFVQPSEITGQVHSVGGVFIVWIVAGILTFFGALVCAELSSIFTKTGGVYTYLKEAFNPAMGFLWGWAMFWSMHTGIIAAVAVIFARYTGYFFPLNDLEIKLVAIILILFHSAVNYFGVKHGSMLQTLVTAGKVLVIGIIILAGFAIGSKLPNHFEAGSFESMSTSPGDILSALIAGLFAFGGWHMVTYNSEETVDAKRTIPKALLWGTLIVTVCYLALNTVYLYVLPLDKVASSTKIAADTADYLMGSGGGMFMAGLVMFSTFGSISGIILTGPRVYYSMAQDGLLFKWVGVLHSRYGTPHRAIFLQAIWASILVFTGTYRELFTRVIYTEWIFFGLMAIGLILLRKRKDISRGYSIFGYPWIPVIFIICCFTIVFNHILNEPVESLTGLSYVLAGLVVYFFLKFNKKSIT
ncbi:MAG TPA: amino acid permease [Cyclobacteriaceae bacterium]|jgi:APA family basic amino acid/polyamine antiporter